MSKQKVKTLDRKILTFQEKDFFIPVRDKIDYIWMLMHACRLIILGEDDTNQEIKTSFKVIISKMSRIFFYKEGKFFSIAFPFNININDSEFPKITSYSGKIVDSGTISSVIAILKNERFRLNPSPISIWVDTDAIDQPGLSLLEELFLTEPSYVRYDNDPDRVNGKLHPLNHIDVNYSSYGTYKLGLNNIIADRYFENILDISTDCLFLNE